jgi:hypothetical protein
LGFVVILDVGREHRHRGALIRNEQARNRIGRDGACSGRRLGRDGDHAGAVTKHALHVGRATGPCATSIRAELPVAPQEAFGRGITILLRGKVGQGTSHGRVDNAAHRADIQQ